MWHSKPSRKVKDGFGARPQPRAHLRHSRRVTVEANYKLVDTDTGEVIWERTERVAETSGGGSNPIAMAISAALTALTVDYRPLARRMNVLVVDKPGQGLPAGPYRSEYKNDYPNYRD